MQNVSSSMNNNILDILDAIQEFDDNVYHESFKPNISIKAKALALKALNEMLVRELQTNKK